MTVLQYVLLMNTHNILFCLRLLCPKAVKKFFLLPLCGTYTLFWGFFVGMFFWYGCFYLWWIFYYVISNYWFFQARLLVLLRWSILYKIAEVICMFEYFLCVFPKIFNSRINSYIIFCSSLFLFLIHLALLYITLYWLCVLAQIVSTF